MIFEVLSSFQKPPQELHAYPIHEHVVMTVIRGGMAGSCAPDCSMLIVIPNAAHTSLENGWI